MLFLGFLNNVIMNNIKDGWRSLLMLLCEPIYKLISYTYDLFEVIGTADLLTNEKITTIFNRISLLLGIFMLFKLVLSFVQMLINPDNITDKEKGVGNLTKKAILVVILLGITPTIFSKAMELQNFIVGVDGEKNVIAKIILPSGDESQFEDFGAELSAYLFTAFYTYDSDFNEQRRLGNIDDSKLCNLIEDSHKQNGQTFLYRSIKNNKGDISVAYNCLDEDFTYEDEISDEEVKKYTISFSSSGIFAVVVGIVILWMLISYTIAVGVRVVQLVFLRVISPLAIMGYLSPKKDGMFEKWLKMCTSTYIDLFIRMAIIYFIIYIISLLIGDTGLGLAIYKDFDPEQMWIINVVIIIALLIFAKKAPELLKELFPKGGAGSIGYGFKSPKKMLDDMLGGKQLWNATKRTAGFGLGAVTGGAIGFLGGRGAGRVSGLFGGIGRGAFNGAKKGGLWSNLKGVGTKQAQVNKQKIDWRNNNSTWEGRMAQRFANAFGYAGAAEGFENQMAEYDIGKKDKNGNIIKPGLNTLNAQSSALNEVIKLQKANKEEAHKDLREESFTGAGEEKAWHLKQRYMSAEHISKYMSQGLRTEALSMAQTEYNRLSGEIKKLESQGITTGDAGYDKLVRQRNQTVDTMNKINNSVRAENISKQLDALKENEIIKEYMKIKADPNPSDDDLELLKAWDDFDEVKQYFSLSSQLDNLNDASYNAALAEKDKYEIQKEIVEDYNNFSMSEEATNNNVGSSSIRKNVRNIENIITHENNKELFNNLELNGQKITLDLSSFAGIKTLDKAAKAKSGELEQDIYTLQTAKDALSKSEAKKAADADRSAVGGHSGGKK